MNIRPVNLSDFKKLAAEGVTILDVREPERIGDGFVPGSLFVSPEIIHSEAFESGVKKDDRLLLITDEADDPQLLIDSGYTNIAGYLEGGIDTWMKEGNAIDIIISIDADELMLDMKYDKPMVVDIREKDKFDEQHLKGADHVPAEILMLSFDELPEDTTYYLYDEGNDLPVFIITFLKRLGLHNFYLLNGGIKALNEQKAEME